MKIRLMCTKEESRNAIEQLKQGFKLLEVSEFYANRGNSELGRVYVECKPLEFKSNKILDLEEELKRWEKEHNELDYRMLKGDYDSFRQLTWYSNKIANLKYEIEELKKDSEHYKDLRNLENE